MKPIFTLCLAVALLGAVKLKAQENPTKKAIQDLVATVCLKGSITLTPEQKTQIADWLGVNGEAIKNVHPSEFKGEGPTMTDPKAAYTWHDVRFAESKDALYVFVMDVPQGDMKIKELCTTIGGRIIGTVKLLGSGERMSWEMEERELNLEKPHVLPKDGVTVFKVTWTEYYKERPVDKTIKILTP
ncbi:MAG: hypothetical protein V4592_04345 [Bacteroidota bacterium]